MNLKLLRYSSNNESTLGLLFVDDKFECYVLEDEYRAEKVKGETRIPAGTFDIKYREVISGMTERYRNKYDFFTWHLELQNVPNFKYVYMHAGNKDDDTDGCILVGDSANNNKVDDGFIGYSRNAFERIYLKIAQKLDIFEAVQIKIVDMDI
jgi:hypothetical protein